MPAKKVAKKVASKSAVKKPIQPVKPRLAVEYGNPFEDAKSNSGKPKREWSATRDEKFAKPAVEGDES